VKDDFSKIEQLAAERKWPEAKIGLEALPPMAGGDLVRRARLASSVYFCLGDIATSLTALESMLNSTEAEIRDFYLASEYALELLKLDATIKHASRAIEISLARGDRYFVSACYLLRAYAYIKSGDSASARKDIAQLPEDSAITWLFNAPRLSRSSLLALID
jgi:tetratricopeptide (TPR) repeat protein